MCRGTQAWAQQEQERTGENSPRATAGIFTLTLIAIGENKIFKSRKVKPTSEQTLFAIGGCKIYDSELLVVPLK